MKAPSKEMEARFWAKVLKTDKCWLWTAAKTHEGYGRFSAHDRRTVIASRFSYELLVGPIPPKLTIDHLCCTPACVNPAHMEVVPMGVNTLRGNSPWGINHKKTHCKRGHPLSGQNLSNRSDGSRQCKKCDAWRQRGYRARPREEYDK